MTDSTLLTIRAVGRPARRRIRVTYPDGRIMGEYRIGRGETEQEAHLKVVSKLAEHPEFMGVVDTSANDADVPLEIE